MTNETFHNIYQQLCVSAPMILQTSERAVRADKRCSALLLTNLVNVAQHMIFFCLCAHTHTWVIKIYLYRGVVFFVNITNNSWTTLLSSCVSVLRQSHREKETLSGLLCGCRHLLCKHRSCKGTVNTSGRCQCRSVTVLIGYVMNKKPPLHGAHLPLHKQNPKREFGFWPT